jgi:hypothetical protein
LPRRTAFCSATIVRALRRRDIEGRRSERDEHEVGAAHGIAQVAAVQRRRRVDDDPLRV